MALSGSVAARASDRRGIALALVLVALMLIGALAGLAVAGARRDRHEASIGLRSARAFAAAEAGLSSALAGWPAPDAAALAPGAFVQLAPVAVTASESFTLSLARLAGELYLIRSEGRAGAARRQLAQVVRLHPSALLPQSALGAFGPVRLDSARLAGSDTTPAGWGAWCSTPGPDAAGLRLPDAASVITATGCTGLGCVTGAPALAVDTGLTARRAEFLAAFDSAAAREDRVVSGDIAPAPVADSAGRCATGVAANWGEPDSASAACAGWLPIVVAPGDLRITGGRGQGVLLVRGDLELSGGAEFVGPVVVLGTLRITAAGGRIVGGALAFGGADMAAGAIVRSACAVSRGSAAAARPRRVPGGWVELD